MNHFLSNEDMEGLNESLIFFLYVFNHAARFEF